MRGLRSLHTTRFLRSDFSHAVIGGGIVGTAIASELQKDGHNVLLIERHGHLGTETTSRNSEVIHAGLYYPKDTLKSKLCIEGKNMIYEAVEKGIFNQVGVQKCGKLVVAQDEVELEYLEKLYHFTNEELGVETQFMSQKAMRARYPHIGGVLALDSPTTGIVLAHDLLFYHQTQFENHEGTIAYNTKVSDIERNHSNYTIISETQDGPFDITADIVINSAGLHAQKIANMVLPESHHYKSFFAKGTYFSYLPGKSLGRFTDKLIYPCPNPNASSLGTHLTFDMGGQVKFGPDLEWLDIDDAELIDYTPSYKNLEAAYEAVKRYFPPIQLHELQPSYSGVRPKICSAADAKKQFCDFIIKEELPGFVNLIGIESPGVTSCWSIAKYVKLLL